MNLFTFLYLLAFVLLRDFYLVLLALALRWTFVEYKHTEFLREFLTRIFNLNKYTAYAWKELLACPFCSGVWAGYAVFLVFKMEWFGLSWQLFEFWLFALCCGLLSLIVELKLSAMLKDFTDR